MSAPEMQAESGTAVEGPRDPVTGQFRPGFSGNPAGRPRRKTFEERVRERLAERGIRFEQREDDLAEQFVEAMLAGDKDYVRAYVDRDWPVPKRVELGGFDGGPIQLARADAAALPAETAAEVERIAMRTLQSGEDD